MHHPPQLAGCIQHLSCSVLFMRVPFRTPSALFRRSKRLKFCRLSATASTNSRPRTRSPYELVHFRRSRYVAHLNELRRRNALPPGAELDAPSALEQALASEGNKHELRIVQQFVDLIAPAASQSPVTECIPLHAADRYFRTEKAIQNRIPVIQQAALTDGFYGGYADLLILDSLNPCLSPDARRAAHPASYSVFEIKLASTNRVDYALQTAIYSKMLSQLLQKFGAPACRHAYLCLGNSADSVKPLDVNALSYLLQRTHQDYVEFLRSFRISNPLPDIDGPLTALRPWAEYAQEQLDGMDSLLNIAGIRRSQARFIAAELHTPTLTSFANLPSSQISCAIPPTSSSGKVLRQLHMQAQLQLETSRNQNSSIAYRVLEPEDVRTTYGLNRVAPRHSSDVFFDIEGYPLFEEGGLEYLFGCTSEEDGLFHSWWAHSRLEEENAFIRLIDWLWSRATAVPGNEEMRIYHYGNYEISALRRIAARTTSVAGKEAGRRLERLIGAGNFVDIYKVVKSGLMVGERSYSIKKVEKLVGVSRGEYDLADAQSSVAMYHQWRTEKDFESTDENGLVARAQALSIENDSNRLLREISMYNKQDCDSLRQVVMWLRTEARKNGIEYQPLPRIEEASAVLTTSDGGDTGLTSGEKKHYHLVTKSDNPPEACGRTDVDKANDGRAIRKSDEISAFFLGSSVGRENVAFFQDVAKRAKPASAELQSMAHLLHFHARESSPARYRFMDRVTKAFCLDLPELINDHECLAPVKLISFNSEGRGSAYEYKFDPAQGTSIKRGSSVAVVIGNPLPAPTASASAEASNGYIADFMHVSSIDKHRGNIVAKSNKNVSIPSGTNISLVRSDELILCAAPMRRSLLRTAEMMITEGASPNVIVSNFLSRKPPCGSEVSGLVMSETLLTKANLPSVLQTLQGNTVVIQGPPGSGKTTFSAQLIRDLLNSGKTVAVSSNSHAAIDNLLGRVISLGINPQTVCKIGPRTDALRAARFSGSIARIEVGTKCEEHVVAGSSVSGVKKKRSSNRKLPVALVGATVYGLSRASDTETFDFLFVDEASQVPMANFVAMAPCAKSAVLVGDQQQLEMPLQGAHSELVQKSCLSHLVGDGVNIVSPARGVFLDTSFRMQPDICQFISTHFYDGALLSHDRCANNHIEVANSETSDGAREALLRTGRGIVFLASDGEISGPPLNSGMLEESSKHSKGEARIVGKAIQELLGAKCTVNGESRRISESDILVVSSFNAQVQNLQNSVPSGIRVGTVDKFQGQEAPVVIISTCAAPNEYGEAFVSTAEVSGLGVNPEGSNRNLQFTTNPNRINVAVSRASCLAIVVGHSEATRRAPVHNLEDARSYALYELLADYKQRYRT